MIKKILLVGLFSFTFSYILSTAVFAAPPPNFQAQMLASSQLSTPTGIGLAPDGRVFILEQDGRIRIYQNGNLLPDLFAQLPAYASGDRGLLGVTFDPDFTNNHWVYFYYIDSNSWHKVVRFNASENIAKDGPIEIFSVQNPAPSTTHAGGTIEFGPDGKLYIGIGDVGNGLNAQSLQSLFGKILRINKDGSIPSDNPFGNAIWAYGVRNPFRFHFDPSTSKLYLGDVGLEKWEEVNVVVKGGNYGWPYSEGSCTSCPYINPIYEYPHDGNGASITGGPVYRGSMFPLGYQGSLFYADYVRGYIKRLIPDANGVLNKSVDFDPTAGSITDFKVASDGSLYYIRIYPAALFRLVYNSSNQPPQAVASANPVQGAAPLAVQFSGDASSDPDGSSLSYQWDFGDGQSSLSVNPTHTYNNPGTYQVVLTVQDSETEDRSDPISIKVGAAPQFSISSPVNGSKYSDGDQISYSAVGDNASYTTEVIAHHNTHIHPFIKPFTSQSGQFTIPTTGEFTPDTWYEIKITATNNDNLSTTHSVEIFPNVAKFTLQTQPNGLKLNLNGVPVSESIIDSVVGFEHILNAPNQILNNTNYVFSHWSNGGDQTKTFKVPSQDSTLVANFKPVSSKIIGDYFNNQTLSQPVLTREEAQLKFDWGESSPDPLINSNNFSSRWIKTVDLSAGLYRFTVTADDGVRLRLDGRTILDKFIDQPATRYVIEEYLDGGAHTWVVEYYEDQGQAVAKLDLLKISDSKQIDFKADYYSSKDLTGVPYLSRYEPEINHSWGWETANPALPDNQFSTRWRRSKEFLAGTYSATIVTDDGFRLFIDNNLVFDRWFDQPPTYYKFDLPISAGSHTIMIEYYENYGEAKAYFDLTKK